jgi:hypothetical protein
MNTFSEGSADGLPEEQYMHIKVSCQANGSGAQMPRRSELRQFLNTYSRRKDEQEKSQDLTKP